MSMSSFDKIQEPGDEKRTSSSLDILWSVHYSKMIFFSFWILGFCNSFPFLIILSAAHDFLEFESKNDPIFNKTSSKYECNNLSTGIVLLADILPGILVKLITPFFVHKFQYWQRALLVIISSAASFTLISFTDPNELWLLLVGVIVGSFSTSFGEMTYLSLSTLYPTKLSFTAWSSGSGSSGIIATLIYACLVTIISPQKTVLVMLIIPFLMAFGYIIMPSHEYKQERVIDTNHVNQVEEEINIMQLNFKEKLCAMIPLLKYMIPLFFVYYAEYLINQGLFELMYFTNEPIFYDHCMQYRWYNVVFRFGVFLARQTIYFFQIRFLSAFSILQILNLSILLTQVMFNYIPNIWIVISIIFWEGLVGGGIYANAFKRISTEIPKDRREFSIAITTITDSLGIAFAGITALPIHNLICRSGKL